MARSWLYRKKKKIRDELWKIFFGTNIFVFFMAKEYFVGILIITSIAWVSFYLFTNKSFKRREGGISAEDYYSEWLVGVCAPHGIKVQTSITMKYGDIDIYLPGRDIIIDIKSYKKVDSRISSEKNLRSIARQMLHVRAKIAIIWLPMVKDQRRPIQIQDGVYLVCGKRGIIKALEIENA